MLIGCHSVEAKYQKKKTVGAHQSLRIEVLCASNWSTRKMVNVDQVAQMTTTITAASTEKTYDTEIGIKEGKYFIVSKSNIYSGLHF